MPYLTEDHVTSYLKTSADTDRMVIATDACGAGKTEAMLQWVTANSDWSVVIAVERKEQADTYRRRLHAKGVPADDIAVLHSGYPQELKQKYDSGERYTKRICLITHARIWLDPPQLWTASRSRKGTILLMDEVLLNTIKSIYVNAGFLPTITTYLGFDCTKYRNCFDDAFDRQALRDITPQDQETILRYISVLYAKLLDTFQHDTDVKGDILAGISSEPEDIDLPLDTPERVAYFACLVTYAILMEKTHAVPKSLVKCVSIVSPLLLWSHEFEASVLFDGTGELFPYPKDSCTIVAPSVKPRPLVHVKLVPISGDKRAHLRRVHQDPTRYYREVRAQLSRVVTALAAQYAQIYICTWHDKAAEAYEHHTSEVRSTDLEVETIVRITDRPQFEIAPVLKVETLLWDIVHQLELTARVFVSHYGLSRGSNAFRDYDCVLLVGHFYYPIGTYRDLQTFSTISSLTRQTAHATYGANPLPLVLAHMVQECMRVRSRQGHSVDCYLCVARTDRDYGAILSGLHDLKEFAYYIHSIEHSDLEGNIIAAEHQVKFQYLLEKYLTSKQEHRMVQLVERYPALLTERHLTIDTADLGRLWACQPYEVCHRLNTIVKRSHQLITYDVLEPGKQGRKSTKLQVHLQPIA